MVENIFLYNQKRIDRATAQRGSILFLLLRKQYHLPRVFVPRCHMRLLRENLFVQIRGKNIFFQNRKSGSRKLLSGIGEFPNQWNRSLLFDLGQDGGRGLPETERPDVRHDPGFFCNSIVCIRNTEKLMCENAADAGAGRVFCLV